MSPEQSKALVERLETAFGELPPQRKQLYVQKLLPSWYEWGHRGVEAVIEHHESPRWPTVAEVLDAIRAVARQGGTNGPLVQQTSTDPGFTRRAEENRRGIELQDKLLAMDDDEYMRWLYEVYSPARAGRNGR